MAAGEVMAPAMAVGIRPQDMLQGTPRVLAWAIRSHISLAGTGRALIRTSRRPARRLWITGWSHSRRRMLFSLRCQARCIAGREKRSFSASPSCFRTGGVLVSEDARPTVHLRIASFLGMAGIVSTAESFSSIHFSLVSRRQVGTALPVGPETDRSVRRKRRCRFRRASRTVLTGTALTPRETKVRNTQSANRR